MFCSGSIYIQSVFANLIRRLMTLSILARTWIDLDHTSISAHDKGRTQVHHDVIRNYRSIFSSINFDTQLEYLNNLVPAWQGLAFRLHPTLTKNTNIDVISHLTDDIRRFRPMYCWWAYPGVPIMSSRTAMPAELPWIQKWSLTEPF